MKKEDEQIRVALYIRVSTVEQMNGFGIDMQKDALLKHVERNSYKGWHTDAKWIYEEQASAGDKDRGELQRLLKDAKAKKFDLVLVWKIDRISRSLNDLLSIFEELNESKVSFASLKEDIDFTGAIGKLIFQIFGALAEFERETIKMRTHEGKLMSARMGNFVGGGIPYAYKKVTNSNKGSKLELVKDEVPIAKMIFNMFLEENETYSSIARKLNQMKIPKGISAREKDKGTKWLPNTIRNMLENDIYRGKMISNRMVIVSKKPKRYEERPRQEWIIKPCPAIISDIEYLRVLERISESSTTRKGRGGGKNNYLFASKLIDAKTGKGFVGYKSAKDTKNYRRHKFTDKVTGEAYKTISISEKALYDQFWPIIQTAIKTPKLFIDLHKKTSDLTQDLERLQAKYKTCEKQLSEYNNAIQRVKDDYYRGNIEESERDEQIYNYQDARDKVFCEYTKTENEIRLLDKHSQACLDVVEFSRSFKDTVENLNYNDKQKLIEILVDSIVITDKPNGERNANIKLRFEPSVISAESAKVRTNSKVSKPNKPIPTENIDVNGGR